jgi:hypothetical protein
MMNKIKKIISAMFIVIVSANPVFASINIPSLYTPTAIVHEILLIFAVISLVWAMKVLSLVRGGLMSKSWQMFVLGICFLICAQLIVISEQAGLLAVPGYVSSAIYLLMAFTWLLGIYQTRKVLG